jgi:hypothetical protein
MKSIRLILAVTAAVALMAGVSWAKDHSEHHGKKDSTSVCHKVACDSMDMAKCKDTPMKGHCKKDSMAVCQKPACDSTNMARCKESQMKGHCMKDSTAKCDSTCAKECKHAGKMDACKKDQKKDDAVIEQTNCPVMGGAINKDIFVEHNGKKVYFCCEECKAKYLKDPDKYPLKQ